MRPISRPLALRCDARRLAIAALALVLAVACAGTAKPPASAAGSAPVAKPAESPAPARAVPGPSAETVAKIEADLVWVRPGSLAAGFRSSRSFATSKRDPAVKIGGFWVGKHEVTQEEWVAVMGDNPSEAQDDPRLPVTNVSWPDANRFLDRLNHEKGETAFRLLSAEEWEYGCRAGTVGHVPAQATETALDQFAWWGRNSGKHAHPVAGLKPNAWGIYDMLGNVAEWCETADDDARGNTPLRVIAGANFADANLVSQDCRPGGAMAENGRDAYTGFRVARRGAPPSASGKRSKK